MGTPDTIHFEGGRVSMSHRIGTDLSVESWEQTLEFFLLFKQSQGVCERTLDDYRHHA